MEIDIEEHLLFFNAAYSGFLNHVDSEKIVKEAYDLREKSEGLKKSNRGGWHSEGISTMDMDPFPETKVLTSELKNIATKIHRLWKISQSAELVNMWFNINKKDGYNISHFHPHCTMSAVFYAKVPENSGNIVFQRSDIQGHYFHSYEETPYTYDTFSFYPQEGMFLIFPSYLSHSVEPNESDEDRISLAFNFRQ